MFSKIFGNQYSVEQALWKNPHVLRINKEVQQAQIPLLDNFKPQLYLCYNSRNYMNVKYKYWFVTDKMWTIEFILEGKQFTAANVVVHTNNPGSELPIIDEKFMLTPEVKERMKQVCGATNYSLALRNCEHVAR